MRFVSSDHEGGSGPLRVLLLRNLQEATFQVKHMIIATWRQTHALQLVGDAHRPTRCVSDDQVDGTGPLS